MEIPTTPEFRKLVRRQMLDEAKRQLDRVNGVSGTGGHRAGPALRGEEETRAPMGMSRGRVVSYRPPLMLIEGGKK